MSGIIAGLFNYQRQPLLNGGLDQFYVRTTVADAGPYVVVPNDTIIAVTFAGSSTITLPSIASNIKGHRRLLVIIDEAGTAETFPITITPDTADELDNAGAGVSFNLNWNNGALILYAENDTPGWHILDRPPSAAVSGTYNPARPTDWQTAPTTVASALDKLAYGYFIAHGVVPNIP